MLIFAGRGREIMNGLAYGEGGGGGLECILILGHPKLLGPREGILNFFCTSEKPMRGKYNRT